MRDNPTKIVEDGRVLTGPYGSPSNSGCQGAFFAPGPEGQLLKIISTDGIDPEAAMFEHVSASCQKRAPTWGEMQWLKEQFWNDDEVCFQLHPSKESYVNCHPYTLHIWRHRLFTPPLPPTILIGPK